MTRPTYSNQITLGNLIQMATVLLALAGAWYGLVNRIERMEEAQVWRDLQTNNRLTALSEQMTEQRSRQTEAERETRRLRERLIAKGVLNPD